MTTRPRVIVTGATGLIGKRLCPRLTDAGYDVVVFSRNPDRARDSVPATAYYAWDAQPTPGAWAEPIAGSHAIINLAGAPILGKRWDADYKREMYRSRVGGTQGIVAAIAALAASDRPAALLNGSAVGFYGFRDDTPLAEDAPPGNDFTAKLTIAWEAAAQPVTDLGVRLVLLRTGIVLDTAGGALKQLLPPFQLGAGGPILPGTQYFSWIHATDEVEAIGYALQTDSLHGALNLTAPAPVTNNELTRTLADTISRPALIPIPGFGLQVLFGEVAETLTHGQRVIPQALQTAGFRFAHPTLAGALTDLLKGN